MTRRNILQEEKINKIFPGLLNDLELQKALKKIQLSQLILASTYYDLEDIERIEENLKTINGKIFYILGTWRKKRNYKYSLSKKSASKIEATIQRLIKQGEIELYNDPLKEPEIPLDNLENKNLQPHNLPKTRKNQMNNNNNKKILNRDPEYSLVPGNLNSLEKFIQKIREVPGLNADHVHIAKILLEISTLAQNNGKTQLKTLSRECNNELLKTGLENISKGTSSKTLEEILQNKKKRAMFEQEMLMDMIIESILSIQKGDSTEIIKDTINSYYL